MEKTQEKPVSKNWAVPFFTILIGQAFSLVGSQLVQFAIVWWVTQTTGSASMLSLATLVALVPQIVLGPFVGTLVDRWNRRLTLIVADGISALALVVMTYLFWTDQVELWHVFVIMFVRSLANGFHWPAMQASVTLMVPKDYYTRIQGLNQIMMGLMMIMGAPLGALLLSVLPIYGIMMIDIVTAIIAIVPLLFIPIPQPPRMALTEGETKPPTVWQDFKAGFRYVFTWKGLVGIITVATLVNLLLTPSSSLIPILVTNVFSGKAIQLAWMQSAWGIGTIVGGLILSAWGGFKRRIVTALAGLIALGVGTVLLGLAPRGIFFFAVGLSFFMGFTSPFINGPLLAVVQSAVDPQMQGRVFTLTNSLAGAMTPLGLLVAGPMADLFGVRVWYILGGILTMLLGIITFGIPAIMQIEEGRTPQIAEKEQPVLRPID